MRTLCSRPKRKWFSFIWMCIFFHFLRELFKISNGHKGLLLSWNLPCSSKDEHSHRPLPLSANRRWYLKEHNSILEHRDCVSMSSVLNSCLTAGKRARKFSFHHPSGSSLSPVIPFLGELLPSSGLCEHYTHVTTIYLCRWAHIRAIYSKGKCLFNP